MKAAAGANADKTARCSEERERGLDDFNLLAKLGHAVGREHALPMHTGINDRIASDQGARTHHGIASDFGAVADDRTKLAQPGGHGTVCTANDHLSVVEADIG